MPEIHIMVSNKIATGDGSRIVCGNSDYMAVFSFDEEWAAHDVKTARFVYPGGAGDHIDVIFEGNTCSVPVLHNTIGVKVGVFAGELHTTTSAWFDCKKSVLCESGGSPVPSSPDVYAQLLEKINHLEGATPEQVAAAVAKYMEKNPIDSQNVFIVNIVEDDSDSDNLKWAADKTPEEIHAAWRNDVPIYCKYNKSGLPLCLVPFCVSNNYVLFVGFSTLPFVDTNSPIVVSVIITENGVSDGTVFLKNSFLPGGGKPGQILVKTETGAEWADITIPKEYGLVTYDQDKTITVS